MIDLFILLALTIGTLVTVSAALLGVVLLAALVLDLLLPKEPDWDYQFDPPFNMDEEVH